MVVLRVQGHACCECKGMQCSRHKREPSDHTRYWARTDTAARAADMSLMPCAQMLWFAAYVIVGGCNTADRAQYARPPHNDPSMVTRSQAGSSTAGSVMMHLHVALHALSSCTSSATLIIVRIWIYICACLIICLLTLLVLVARTLRSGWDALLQ